MNARSSNNSMKSDNISYLSSSFLTPQSVVLSLLAIKSMMLLFLKVFPAPSVSQQTLRVYSSQ